MKRDLPYLVILLQLVLYVYTIYLFDGAYYNIYNISIYYHDITFLVTYPIIILLYTALRRKFENDKIFKTLIILLPISYGIYIITLLMKIMNMELYGFLNTIYNLSYFYHYYNCFISSFYISP